MLDRIKVPVVAVKRIASGAQNRRKPAAGRCPQSPQEWLIGGLAIRNRQTPAARQRESGDIERKAGAMCAHLCPGLAIACAALESRPRTDGRNILATKSSRHRRGQKASPLAERARKGTRHYRLFGESHFWKVRPLQPAQQAYWRVDGALPGGRLDDFKLEAFIPQ